MSLRPYQLEALSASKQKFQSGVTRQLIAMPTGTGKTVVFASIPEHHRIPGRMLVIVHREELADQAADKLRRWNPHLKVGVEMGYREASNGDDIIVGSVQTLGRKGSLRLEKLRPEDFGVIVCDEAHHSVADSYKTVFDHFGLRTPENQKLLLGVTATPNRSDGLALGQVYDEIVYQIPILDAIRQGWLSDMRGIKLSTETSLDSVHTRAGDFAQDELQNAVNTPYRNGVIVQGWLKHAASLQTLVFTVDIAHAKDLANTFKSYGVAAEAVWGDDPHRAEKLALHREGKLQVLANCAVLTEGYDDWRIKCIIMARPTKSQLLFVQMAGRGTRIPDNINNLHEAKAAGQVIAKDNCLLIDVVDNTTRHSLVTLASIFGLSEKMDMRGKGVSRVVGDLEKAQAEHPGIDLAKLEDIDRLKSYIEEVDLFQVKFSEEVLEYSQLQWHKFGPDTYRLLLPDGEKVIIWKDLFDEWEVVGKVRGNEFRQNHIKALPEAFQFAEQMVTMFGKNLLTLLRREAKWHKQPATSGQLRLLSRLKIPYPATILKGEAAKLINQALNRNCGVNPVKVA